MSPLQLTCTMWCLWIFFFLAFHNSHFSQLFFHEYISVGNVIRHEIWRVSSGATLLQGAFFDEKLILWKTARKKDETQSESNKHVDNFSIFTKILRKFPLDSNFSLNFSTLYCENLAICGNFITYFRENSTFSPKTILSILLWKFGCTTQRCVSQRWRSNLRSNSITFTGFVI